MELDPAKRGKVAKKLFENLKRSGVSAENLEMIEREALEWVRGELSLFARDIF